MLAPTAGLGRFAELGVGLEVLVALLGERSVDFLVAVLSVFKAGGAYLPLDPASPLERQRAIVASSGARVVLRFTGKNGDSPHSVLPGLEAQSVLEGSPRTDNPPALASARNLAYVIYTSGSTGIPKGAMLEHRGMVNHLFAKQRALRLGPPTAVAQNASQCFDISVWQFLVALLVGGRTSSSGTTTPMTPRGSSTWW